jgi:hypothetical protein
MVLQARELDDGIRDTPPESDFDGVARMVAQLCETPADHVAG